MGVSGVTGQGEKRSHLASEMSRHAGYRQNGWWPGDRLVDRYKNIAETRPDDLAVSDDRGNRLTHAELWTAAGKLSETFSSRGIAPRDIVVICLPNWADWQVVHLAIHRVGAIPANIPLRTDPEMLVHAVKLIDARCLITAKRFDNRDTGKNAQAVAAACDHRIDVLTIDDTGRHSWLHNESELQGSPCSDDQLDHIMFTSSTTGRPKAVMHSADTLAAFNLSIAGRFGLGPHSPVFMASPLGHSVGAIHGARLCLFFGSPLILQQRWDPVAALALIEEYGCAFTAAATPFLKDLLDLKWRSTTPKLASMKAFLCGGAQVPPSMMQQAKEEFPNTFTTVLWGMTEGGVTTCVPSESSDDKILHTAGKPTMGCEVQIIANDEQPLAPGEEGELVVRGPCMFVGYFGQDEFYRSQLTTDGFFRTGDLATLDEEGYVRITGRLKDLIIRGGVNISPVPVEDVLAAHGDVKSVAVIGFPDPRLGERICAIILTENPTLDLAGLTAFAQKKGLPKHLLPEKVLHIDNMPMTPAGKIRKNDVRAWLAARIETDARVS